MTDTRTTKRTFDQVAEWYPDEPAFVQALGDRRLTYGEANDSARRIANGLSDLGVEKGDRVAVLADPTVEHALVFFAVQKLGAISSTLHVRESTNTLCAMVRDLGASAVVFDSTYADVAESFRDDDNDVEAFVEFGHDGEPVPFGTTLSDLEGGASDHEPDVEVDPDDVAFVNFSSGTTGRPKGIVHTHEEAVEAAHGGLYTFGATDADVMLVSSTPSFIAWKIHVLPMVAAGATMVFMGEWQPERVPMLVEEEAVTVLFLVPTQWKMVAQSDLAAYGFDSVRLAGYGGEALNPDLFHYLQETVTENFSAQYGTTETMESGLVLLPHRVNEETLESIGRPLPNVDVRIVEPEGHDPSAEVQEGEVGELIVRGPAVAERVWDDPEKTAEIFHEDGWWFSGDLARKQEDGNVYLQGRTDNMIISGGINVYAEGVEAVLEGHPDVAQCAVVGVPDETWNEAVKAYVVRASPDLTAERLEAWCRDNDDLADYQRPRYWEFVEALPRTNTGKLDRTSLREQEPDD